jgi:hypothetical protein
MTVAAKTEDWQSLKRYDGQLRELLDTHKPFLKDPRLAPEVERARQAHLSAYEMLSVATSKLKQKLNSSGAEKERAMAYQLAMTLE